MLRALWAPKSVLPPIRHGRHGGWRQQLLQDPPEETAGGAISMLAAGLLLDWSEGVLSASKLQRYLSLVYFFSSMFKRISVWTSFFNIQQNLLEFLSCSNLEALEAPCPCSG